MAHGKSGGLKLKLCWTIWFVFLLIMCILRHCTCCFLPEAWVMIKLMSLRWSFSEICGFFLDMCILRHCTCFLSDDLRKVWGIQGLGPFNHCNCNLRVPQRNEAPMLIYAWWQISRSEIEICNANLYGLGFLLIMCILRHCTCWFCQYVIKAVLCFNSNDCRGVQAENVYLICITACLWCK